VSRLCGIQQLATIEGILQKDKRHCVILKSIEMQTFFQRKNNQTYTTQYDFSAQNKNYTLNPSKAAQCHTERVYTRKDMTVNNCVVVYLHRYSSSMPPT
jgi:hypothetical protein